MPRCTIQLLGRVHAASPLFIIVDALAASSARYPEPAFDNRTGESQAHRPNGLAVMEGASVQPALIDTPDNIRHFRRA